MPKFNTTNLKLESWPPPELAARQKTPSKAVKVTHTPTGIYVMESSKHNRIENRYSAVAQVEFLVNQYYEDHRDD